MRCCNITSTWFTKLILSIVIIFPGRSLTYPSSLQEESLLNSDYKQIADTRSTEQSRDDSNFFSSPGESSGGEGAILSVQTATTRSNDDGLFSSPHLNRREPFLISLKHFLLDQIRGEGR
ncbi:unnamed protein product [Allacma fusca]|uniref:Uncharacterized protein n=1 Tax=Allacma fusca TaxID=39272 RepID=A0A8J2NRX1_9HEXA|nr:unnamed protein product [Allacma fusca]